MRSQRGFSIIELTVVVVLVALVSFAGYKVYNRTHKQVASSTGTSATSQASNLPSPTATDVSPAPTISNTSDLDKAQAALDQNDPESSSNSADTNQLDTQTADF